MDEGDDPYQILGVSVIATDVEIRKAYRKLAVQHHPDKQQDDASREKAHHQFAKLSAAYELLLDPSERKNYDESQNEFVRDSGTTAAAAGKPKKDDIGFRKKKFRAFHFHDPYEIFKRNFEEEFGFEYPGSKYDSVDPELIEQAKKLTKEQGRPEIPMITDGREKVKERQAGDYATRNPSDTPTDGSYSYSANPDTNHARSAPQDRQPPTKSYSSDDSSDKKKKKGFWNPFRRKNKDEKDKKSHDSNAPPPDHSYSSSTPSYPTSTSSYPPPNPGSQALVLRGDNNNNNTAAAKKQDGNSTALVLQSKEVVAHKGGNGKPASNARSTPNNSTGKPTSAISKYDPKPTSAISKYDPNGANQNNGALVEHDGDGQMPNNRPISMETREIKIEHDDGRVETIEETIIKRPDGSTETFRRTDMPDSKSGNWKKKHEMLANAPANGTNDSKNLALTDGNSNSNNNRLMPSSSPKSPTPRPAITDGKTEVVATRGLVPYQGNSNATNQKPASQVTKSPPHKPKTEVVATRGLVPYQGNSNATNQNPASQVTKSPPHKPKTEVLAATTRGLVPYQGNSNAATQNPAPQVPKSPPQNTHNPKPKLIAGGHSMSKPRAPGEVSKAKTAGLVSYQGTK